MTRAEAMGLPIAPRLGVDPGRAARRAARADQADRSAGLLDLGDLVMRALKKDAGVRFWGSRSSVTGAVGLLDRVAPLCFAAPVFFHAVRWTY